MIDDETLAQMLTSTRKLRRRFAAAALKPWDPVVASSELAVQLGHLALCLARRRGVDVSAVDDPDRPITDVGDELADVTLAALSVTVLAGTQPEPPTTLEPTETAPATPSGNGRDEEITALLVLLTVAGQLIEAAMVAHDYRHRPAGGPPPVAPASTATLTAVDQLADVLGLDLAEAVRGDDGRRVPFPRQAPRRPSGHWAPWRGLKMTALARRGADVVKVPTPNHPAETYLIEAMTAAGSDGLRRYIAALRAVGVGLPPDLHVVQHGRAEPVVHHRWVSGIPLPHLAVDPELFVDAVNQIAVWVHLLDDSDACLDTNLANFVLAGGRLVTVDVLPPLLVDLRPKPRDRWETLFDTLCFSTDVTLCALAGYGGRALLTATRRRCGDLAAAILDGCPGHADPRHLGVWWFHARVLAAARALAGTLPFEDALCLFSRTSVVAVRDADEPERQTRIGAAGALADELGLR